MLEKADWFIHPKEENWRGNLAGSCSPSPRPLPRGNRTFPGNKSGTRPAGFDVYFVLAPFPHPLPGLLLCPSRYNKQPTSPPKNNLSGCRLSVTQVRGCPVLKLWTHQHPWPLCPHPHSLLSPHTHSAWFSEQLAHWLTPVCYCTCMCMLVIQLCITYWWVKSLLPYTQVIMDHVGCTRNFST